MSLREAFRATVARCAPLELQHATSGPNRATGHATTAQQPPENPHGHWVSDATAHATGTQQGVKTHATLGPEMGGESCTELHSPGALTAHRMAAELIAAAMRRCDQFNDDDAKRAQMRGDCLELSPRLQLDLLNHFKGNKP
jgi:hypothetical protein